MADRISVSFKKQMKHINSADGRKLNDSNKMFKTIYVKHKIVVLDVYYFKHFSICLAHRDVFLQVTGSVIC
jgi:hypothetical protein